MTAYDELVERCARVLWLDRHPHVAWEGGKQMEAIKQKYRGHARSMLAEVFRTLSVVTPEMLAQACRAQMSDGKPLWVLLADNNRTAEDLRGAIFAMLLASPLAAPEGK